MSDTVDTTHWWAIWIGAANLLVICIAIPFISALRAIRKEDLCRINKSLRELGEQIEKLEKRITDHHEHHPK